MHKKTTIKLQKCQLNGENNKGATIETAFRSEIRRSCLIWETALLSLPETDRPLPLLPPEPENVYCPY